MRIEQSDIDALVETSIWLKSAAESPDFCESKAKFTALHQHCRKVYIMLLQATDHGQLGLKLLCEKGIDDNSKQALAIRQLCPDIGQNKN